MRVALRQPVFAILAVLCAGLSGAAAAQTTPATSQQVTDPLLPASPAFVAPSITTQPDPTQTTADQAPVSQTLSSQSAIVPAGAADSSAVELLRSFNDADIKFDVRDLMEILRDRRHEGWVLAAYPDPKTGHPLIGAGFTLDLPARAHSQSDALNPHPFLEPSSADLWRAAGLDPGRLQSILDQYSGRFSMWKKKRFRQKIRTLAPQITDDEATLLLRIAAIQAIYNAKAYCRNFDQMSASQQMALSQLVYQMGVNLARFDEFLSLLNDGKPAAAGRSLCLLAESCCRGSRILEIGAALIDAKPVGKALSHEGHCRNCDARPRLRRQPSHGRALCQRHASSGRRASASEARFGNARSSFGKEPDLSGRRTQEKRALPG